jgi:hypothetical protein
MHGNGMHRLGMSSRQSSRDRPGDNGQRPKQFFIPILPGMFRSAPWFGFGAESRPEDIYTRSGYRPPLTGAPAAVFFGSTPVPRTGYWRTSRANRMRETSLAVAAISIEKARQIQEGASSARTLRAPRATQEYLETNDRHH